MSAILLSYKVVRVHTVSECIPIALDNDAQILASQLEFPSFSSNSCGSTNSKEKERNKPNTKRLNLSSYRDETDVSTAHNIES
jgi:hypothetical protein